MGGVRALLLLSIGLGFTALLVVLPLAHVSAWSGKGVPTLTAALAALPLLALIATLFRRDSWATLGLFPASHLPALLFERELTGPLVYAGCSGLFALVAVIALGALWTVLALEEGGESATPGPHSSLVAEGGPDRRAWADGAPLPWLAAGLASALVLAMLYPVLGSRAGEDWGAGQLASLGGLAVSLWVASRWVVGELGDAWFDPRARQRWLAAALVERRLSPVALWSSVAIALGAVAAVALVYT